jgi:branched-chain amino acid transport system permease protein
MSTTLPNVPFLLAIAIAGLTCMVFSVLIGFPALRVQGPWLAFVTLAFNLLVFLVLNNEEGLTGGSRGIRIPREDVSVFGIDLFSSRNYYYLLPGVLGCRHRRWCGGSSAAPGASVQGVA